jgi:hypothetical protein
MVVSVGLARRPPAASSVISYGPDYSIVKAVALAQAVAVKFGTECVDLQRQLAVLVAVAEKARLLVGTKFAVIRTLCGSVKIE